MTKNEYKLYQGTLETGRVKGHVLYTGRVLSVHVTLETGRAKGHVLYTGRVLSVHVTLETGKVKGMCSTQVESYLSMSL
jgi:acyl-CoA thioesterase FadM